jgi:hypothetical protein
MAGALSSGRDELTRQDAKKAKKDEGGGGLAAENTENGRSFMHY